VAELQPSDAELLGNRWMRIAVTRAIPADLDVVWSAVDDPSTWLDWYEPLAAFEPIGEPTRGIGAVFHEREWLWKTNSRIVAREPGRSIGLSTESINMPGLLSRYYRRISLEREPIDGSTLVTITGGFRFGQLGLVLFAYTYPQMLGALFVEYRSALRGLSRFVTR